MSILEDFFSYRRLYFVFGVSNISSDACGTKNAYKTMSSFIISNMELFLRLIKRGIPVVSRKYVFVILNLSNPTFI